MTQPDEAAGTAPGRGRLAGRRVLVVGAGTRPSPEPDPPMGNGREHRDGPAVAHRRIRLRRRPRAGAHHQDPPARQPAASRRGARGLVRQGHDPSCPSHIGAAPGGSGTSNEFSRNEISV